MFTENELQKKINLEIQKAQEFYKETLNNIEFKREAFYGLGIDWYAVDITGSLALIITDELPVPKQIFSNENNYKELKNFFQKLPKITTSTLPQRFSEIRNRTQGKVDFLGYLRESEKGIYVISEEIEIVRGERTAEHYLTAIPDKKLYLDNLPCRIKELLSPYHVSVRFSEIKKIDFTKFFSCE